MKTLYEEMLEKGLVSRNITVELALTIPYHYATDRLIGLDIITCKPVAVNQN